MPQEISEQNLLGKQRRSEATQKSLFPGRKRGDRELQGKHSQQDQQEGWKEEAQCSCYDNCCCFDNSCCLFSQSSCCLFARVNVQQSCGLKSKQPMQDRATGRSNSSKMLKEKNTKEGGVHHWGLGVSWKEAQLFIFTKGASDHLPCSGCVAREHYRRSITEQILTALPGCCCCHQKSRELQPRAERRQRESWEVLAATIKRPERADRPTIKQ